MVDKVSSTELFLTSSIVTLSMLSLLFTLLSFVSISSSGLYGDIEADSNAFSNRIMDSSFWFEDDLKKSVTFETDFRWFFFFFQLSSSSSPSSASSSSLSSLSSPSPTASSPSTFAVLWMNRIRMSSSSLLNPDALTSSSIRIWFSVVIISSNTHRSSGGGTYRIFMAKNFTRPPRSLAKSSEALGWDIETICGKEEEKLVCASIYCCSICNTQSVREAQSDYDLTHNHWVSL